MKIFHAGYFDWSDSRFFLVNPICTEKDSKHAGHDFALSYSTFKKCREEFQQFLSKGVDKIGYFHVKQLDASGIAGQYQTLTVERFLDYWNQIETKLGLTLSKCHQVNEGKDIILLEVNPFWMSTTTRQSFFTLFMRAGVYFHKVGEDYTKSLDKYQLAQSIRPAINRFMEGFTQNTYPDSEIWFTYGVVHKFEFKDAESVKEMLVKPEGVVVAS